MIRKIVTFIIVVTFTLNSVTQGYALRPKSTGTNSHTNIITVDDYKIPKTSSAGWHTIDEINEIAAKTDTLAAKRWRDIRKPSTNLLKMQKIAIDGEDENDYFMSIFALIAFGIPLITALLSGLMFWLLSITPIGYLPLPIFASRQFLINCILPLLVLSLFCSFPLIMIQAFRFQSQGDPVFTSLFWPKSFRTFLDNSPYAIEVRKKLRYLGISEHWDDPDYRRTYAATGDGFIEVDQSTTYIPLAQQRLRNFIGEMRDGKIKGAGNMLGTLIKKQKSARTFHRRHKKEIEELYSGHIEKDLLLFLLETLRDHFIESHSTGMAYINEAITAIPSEAVVPGNVDVRIWQRDHWHDLSSSDSLYACVWLGGVREKASLEFIRNKSITMLDFYSGEKHLGRVELAAATYIENGKEHPVLVVACLSGSLDLNREVIQQAIEDYARACNFPYVLYNRHVTNKVPREFITHIEGQNLEKLAIPISFVDTSRVLYMELFLKGAKSDNLKADWVLPSGIVGCYCAQVLPAESSPIRAKAKDYKKRRSHNKFLTAAALLMATALLFFSVFLNLYSLHRPFNIQRYRPYITKKAANPKKYTFYHSPEERIQERAFNELVAFGKDGNREALLLLVKMFDNFNKPQKDTTLEVIIKYLQGKDDLYFLDFLLNMPYKNPDLLHNVLNTVTLTGDPICPTRAEYIAQKILSLKEKNVAGGDRIYRKILQRLAESKQTRLSTNTLLRIYMLNLPQARYVQTGYHRVWVDKKILLKRKKTAKDNRALETMHKESVKKQLVGKMRLLHELIAEWEGQAISIEFLFSLMDNEDNNEKKYPLTISKYVMKKLSETNNFLLKGRSDADIENILKKVLTYKADTRFTIGDRLPVESSRAALSIIQNYGKRLPVNLLETLIKHNDSKIRDAAKKALSGHSKDRSSKNDPTNSHTADSLKNALASAAVTPLNVRRSPVRPRFVVPSASKIAILDAQANIASAA